MTIFDNHAEALSHSQVRRTDYRHFADYVVAVHDEQERVIDMQLDQAEKFLVAGDLDAAQEMYAAYELHAALRDAIRGAGVLGFVRDMKARV